MFTGIVEEIGIVKQIIPKVGVAHLGIELKTVLDGIKIGDSIAVNGVCLTIVSINRNIISFEVIEDTLKNTNISKLRIGQHVNIERALKVGDRLSGHFVTGHVDGLGIIQNKIHIKDTQKLIIKFPQDLSKFIVLKGSICLDGVSLTIQELTQANFSVSLIPHTLKTTTLGRKNISDTLNIEVDALAKYVVL